MTRAAIGHMPFKGHRTCAEWQPEEAISVSLFREIEARNARLLAEQARAAAASEQLVGRWR